MSSLLSISIRILLFVVLLIVFLWLMLSRPILWVEELPHRYREFVDPAALENTVQLLSKDFAPRSASQPDQLNRVADYIKKQLAAPNVNVREQRFIPKGHQTAQSYYNVIAEYGPATNNVIVLGAHYDVAGNLPGADDNASGVAGLLAIGKLLAKQPLKQRVMLVGFTLEEPPFFGSENMGSAVFAQSLVDDNITVDLMISLEMIGYFSEVDNSQHFPVSALAWVYPDKGNFIAIVDQLLSNKAWAMKKTMSAAIELPVYSINAPSQMPGIDFSDHRNFWANDFPAVMVTDTAFFRNPHYHTELDTADRLDYHKMAEVVYGVYQHILLLALVDK